MATTELTGCNGTDASAGLTVNERQEVLGVLNSEGFCDQDTGEVYATLLDEGKYICSERTMYGSWQSMSK